VFPTPNRKKALLQSHAEINGATFYSGQQAEMHIILWWTPHGALAHGGTMSDRKVVGVVRSQNKHDVGAQFLFNRLTAAMADSIISVVHSSSTTCPTAA
jgi:hypothetical protein